MAAVLSQRSPVIGPTPGCSNNNDFMDDYSSFLLSPAAATTNTSNEDGANNDATSIKHEDEEDKIEDENVADNGNEMTKAKADDNEEIMENDEEEKESEIEVAVEKEDAGRANGNEDAKTNDRDEKNEYSDDSSMASATSPLVNAATATTTTTSKRRKRTHYGGLRNMGNTCYLNSALQMIYSLDDLMNELEEVKAQLDAAVLARQQLEEKEEEGKEKQPEEERSEEVGEEKKEDEKQEEVPVMMDEEEGEDSNAGFGVDLLFGFANDDDDATDNDNSKDTSNTAKSNDKDAKEESPYPLLDALLETFKELSSSEEEEEGKSVVATSPQKLKKVLDEKTPLFIGYRQQDSHEFLSTLIDLLDEELKKAMLEYHVGDIEEIQEETKDGDGDDRDDDGAKDVTEMETDDPAKNDENDEEEEQTSEEGHREEKDNDDDVDDEEESLRKKPKHSQNQQETSDASVMRRASSLAELNLEAISDLLHGPTTTTTTTATPSLTASPPMKKKSLSSPTLCKLAGGRMINPISSSSSSLPTVVDESMSIPSNNQEAMLEQDAIPEEEEEKENAVPIDYSITNETSPVAAPLSAEDKETLPMNNQTETKEETAADEEESTPEKKLQVKSTPLSTTFTTQIRNTLTCDSCCYSRSHIESYNHLSLEVEDEGDCSSSNIEEGLRKFLAEEKREIKCEKCFGESATQRMEIVKLPKALLLHLKRFIVDYTPCYTSATYRKNRSAVEFPQGLSLCSSLPPSDEDVDVSCVLGEFLARDVTVPSTTVKQEHSDNEVEMQDVDNGGNDDDDDERENEDESFQRYKLRSIVHHIGSTASCGHYTADALRPYDSKKSTDDEDGENKSANLNEGEGKESRLDWTRFNDSHVSIITKKEATGPSAQRTAYMVVYEFE